jgi:hypothetical protein
LRWKKGLYIPQVYNTFATVFFHFIAPKSLVKHPAKTEYRRTRRVTLSYFHRVENEESPEADASIMTHPDAIHQ